MSAPWTNRSKRLAALAAVFAVLACSLGGQWYVTALEVQSVQRDLDGLSEAFADCVSDHGFDLGDELRDGLLDILPGFLSGSQD